MAAQHRPRSQRLLGTILNGREKLRLYQKPRRVGGVELMVKGVVGVRNLKGIVAASSSARILNLHALAAAPPPQAGYRLKPMFVHPVLNRSMIVKHNFAPGEEDRLAPKRFNATKVLFPFDPLDLNLGGQFHFIEQHDFMAALARHLEYGDLPIERDLETLGILDRLPTLDPFLVREALARREIEVDRCYFRFSELDKAQMLGFVEGEMASLIRLCFGELRAQDPRTKRLSKLLLADCDSPDLAPLQATLRMEDDEFSEAMFSWKALLYYRWRSQALAPALKSTLGSISQLGRSRYSADALRFLVIAKSLLERSITKSWRAIGQTLKLYEGAYQALIQKQNPESFRAFLIQGSGMFMDLGERMGRLEQAISFWTYRLNQHHTGGMSPDEVVDAVRDLLQGLSIWSPPSSTQARAGAEDAMSPSDEDGGAVVAAS